MNQFISTDPAVPATPDGARARSGSASRRLGLWLLPLWPLLLPVGLHAQDGADDQEPPADAPVARALPVEGPQAGDESVSAPAGLAPDQRPGPRPEPLRGTDFAPRERGETVRVTADGSGFFDADENKATFTDNVRVVHPSFNLVADQLDVYLEDNQAAVGNGEGAPAIDSAVTGAAEADGETGGIRLAIARGRRVVVHRLSDEGELMVATCRHATFDGRTREMTLRDWPQVQKGVNLMRATEQSTVIVLTEDGRIRTQGGTRTELVRGADEDAGRVIVPPLGPDDE